MSDIHSSDDIGLRRFFPSFMIRFIEDSRTVGIVLIICTVISLLVTNSYLGESYLNFWNYEFPPAPGGARLPHTVAEFINDALMAFFFLMVGMEIKREMKEGQLASFKQSILPIFAALGGMVVPALIYFGWNHGTDFAHGWGIPMATDIAFSLGVLSLIGKRVPASLTVLLMALAIIDDLGAVVAIAIFYTSDLSLLYLGLSGGLFLILLLFNLFKVKQNFWYYLIGIALWYCVFNSGVHATVAGVLLAFTLPLSSISKIERAISDPVNFHILPLFALANTAILLPGHFGDVFRDPITYGVMMGLILGKPIGITLTALLASKLKIARLPIGLNWHHILGMGLIAGIGFTMSIFISLLAFDHEGAITTAKIAILLASVLSGVFGFIYLKVLLKKEPGLPEDSDDLLQEASEGTVTA